MGFKNDLIDSNYPRSLSPGLNIDNSSDQGDESHKLESNASSLEGPNGHAPIL